MSKDIRAGSLAERKLRTRFCSDRIHASQRKPTRQTDGAGTVDEQLGRS